MPRAELDSLGMFGAVANLGDRVAEAVRTASEPTTPRRPDLVTSVVLAAGDVAAYAAASIVAALAITHAPVPVGVSHRRHLPEWSRHDGTPSATAWIIDLPLGGAHTATVARSGIVADAVATLVVLERAGLIDGVIADIDATVDHLRRRSPLLLGADSPAAMLARRIGRTMPIVYGSGPIGAAAAGCWKSACNTNAKIPAFANDIDRVAGDEICGWAQHGDVTRQVFSLLLLRHSEETDHDSGAFPVIEEICEEIVADVHTVVAEGPNPLAQMCDLVLFGDVVSLELADQAGIDPGPLPILGRFAT